MSARISPERVRLRPTVVADLPAIFAMQCDPLANQLAGTKPREREVFLARWDEVLRDPRVVCRAIVHDGELVGAINMFQQNERDSIGYWIAREQWGRGIAGRAIALLLEEVKIRPLHAQIAADNIASLRALQRAGFVVVDRRQEEETERYLAREVLFLRLDASPGGAGAGASPGAAST